MTGGSILASLRLAVAFLTVVPVRLRGEVPGLGSAAAWFPVVGAAVGALAGVVDRLAEPRLGSSVAAVLAVAALVGLTGALHQDGLADCADGLGVRGDRERQLAVMRDSAIGTFGALALLLWLGLMVTALAALGRDDALRTLVVAGATSRWAVVLHAATTRPARADGLGRSLEVRFSALAVASAFALAAAVACVGSLHGVVVLGVAAAVAFALSAWTRSALGGRTGDTLGAVAALADVAVLLILLGFAAP